MEYHIVYTAEGRQLGIVFAHDPAEAMGRARRELPHKGAPARALPASYPADSYEAVRGIQRALGRIGDSDLAHEMFLALEDAGYVARNDAGRVVVAFPGDDEWRRCLGRAMLEVQ